jgi:hypothetical protein
MSNFNPKESNAIISLINEFSKCAGVIEWFFPMLRERLSKIEEEILDEGTPPDITAKLKMTRGIWLEVLAMPEHEKLSHQKNIESFVQSAKPPSTERW